MDKPNYKALLPNITTFIFDVDGVLTNGKVLITSPSNVPSSRDTRSVLFLGGQMKGYAIDLKR